MPSSFRWPTEEDPVEFMHANCLRVQARMPDECVDACLTDPPYGISFVSHQRKKEERFDAIAGDGQPFVWFLHDTARILKTGGALVCFCRWDVQEAFKQAIVWSGLNIICQLVWDRQQHGMADLTGSPGPQHDVMWLASKGRFKLPGKRPVTVYPFRRLDGAKMVHPTEKPVNLMRALIRDYTEHGDLLWEPFGGSGATAIAAMYEGRRCISTELDEKYVAVQRKRLADFRSEGNLVPGKIPSRRDPKTEEPLV